MLYGRVYYVMCRTLVENLNVRFGNRTSYIIPYVYLCITLLYIYIDCMYLSCLKPLYL